MMFTYMSGVLSTIEKQFEIKSEHSAYMMSGNELSQILMIFFLPAFAKVRRTPLWIAVGKVFFKWGRNSQGVEREKINEKQKILGLWPCIGKK